MPLWNFPSFGTLPAGPSRWFVLSLMVLSPLLFLPLLLLSPFAVTLRAAWGKTPSRIWRMAVIVSGTAAIGLALVSSPLVVPQGIPLRLPATDPANKTEVAEMKTAIGAVNALLATGVALLPVAACSAAHTILTTRRQKKSGNRQTSTGRPDDTN